MNTNDLKKKMIQKAAEEDVKILSSEQITTIAQKEKTISFIIDTFLYLCTIGLLVCVIVSIKFNIASLGAFSMILFIVSLITSIIFTIKDKNKKTIDWAIQKYKRKYLNNMSLIPTHIQDKCMGDYSKFNIDKTIDVSWNIKFMIDNKQKQFIYQYNKNWSKIYKFSDIINYEVYENGNSEVRGTAGKSLIGGAFFGLTGAIIGSSAARKIDEKCTDLQLVIRINDISLPQIVIDYIKNSDYDKDSSSYRRIKNNLHQLCSFLEYMINNKTIEQYTEDNNSNFKSSEKLNKEQLQELKEMLDEGLITQEEYDQKKKQILGL